MTSAAAAEIREPLSGKAKAFIVFGLMMAVSLAALDTTVVGTIMPTIAGELGGLRLFSWVFSVYLLTSTVTVPIYGKLADLYGRKPVILFGVCVFIVASMLCGAAQSMEMLIACRALQGLGAGAVLPIAITIIGDIFTIEERAKIQAFFSGVWGVAGIAGPAVGGVFADHVGWPWAFFINVPFGLASLTMITLYYTEKLEKRPHVLDYWGGIALSGAIVALLMGLLHGGETYGWTSSETLGLFATAIALLSLFLWLELRAPEPLIPLSLFRNRIILVSSLAVFVAGGLMFGVTSYVPLFEQGVFGGSATRAGFVLAPMSLAWVFSAMLSGRMILRLGYYPCAMIGGSALFLGSLLLIALTPDTTIVIAIVAGGIIGAGMGFTTNSTLIAVQNSVAWNQRGVATASTQFFRTIGGALSVAVMGALLNSRLSDRLDSMADAPEGLRAETLLDRSQRADLSPSVLDSVSDALGASLHEMFFVVVAAGALCLAIIAFFPRGQVSDLASSSARPAPTPAPES